MAGRKRYGAQRCDRTEIVDGGGRDELVVVGSYPDVAVAEPIIAEMFAAQVARTPDAVAVEDDAETLTFRQLDSRATDLARRLLVYGAAPEAVIAVALDRSARLVTALVAIAKTGAACLPIDPRYPSERTAHMLISAAAQLVLTDTAFASTLRDTVIEVLLVDAGEPHIGIDRTTASPIHHDLRANPENLAYVIYTSGSTGAPKAVMITQRNVVNMALHGWPSDAVRDRVAMVASPGFDASIFEVWTALFSGGTLVAFSGHLDVLAVRWLVAERGVTSMFVPTPLVHQLAAEDHGWLDRLNHVITGGDVLSPAAVNRLGAAHAQLRVVNGYGPTEATVFTTMHSVVASGGFDHNRVPIGGPLANVQVYVLDARLRLVPLGVPGELYIAGAGLARGYCDRPEWTALRFVACPFGPAGSRMYRTGDVVQWAAAGRLEFLGRVDEQMKIRGFRIEPGEIETALASHPGVAHAVVVAHSTQGVFEDVADIQVVGYVVPDPTTGAHPHAVASGADQQTELAGEVRRYAKGRLPQYMVPAAIVVLDALPVTANGKLDKTALPAPQFDKGVAYRAPATPTEKTVADIYAGVLHLERVDVDESFFDLGGDSLSAMRAIAAINAAFAVHLSVRSMFAAPSVRDLSLLLTAHDSSAEHARKSVRGGEVTEVHAGDLTLEKFIDAATLATAPSLPRPTTTVRTVLLTGATGFLGRYLALQWLERMQIVDGTLICVVRGQSHSDARHRLDQTFDSGDPHLLRHYQALAAHHLQVIAGDKSQPGLGLDQHTWQRLADTVDVIVDPAALVNAVMPYNELFGPNVVGTAELIRLAITSKLKPYTYVSTADVGDQIEPLDFTEDADIRLISPTRTVNNVQVNDYGTSKWAGEVLLREAHDLCGLPVSVFRCSVILADTTYAGQLNMSDLFTRMLLGVVATGIAPRSFYRVRTDGAHFDGLPVEFVANAIATLGATAAAGFTTYHAMNPHDDGIGVDQFLDWIVDAGYSIRHIDDFTQWLRDFETVVQSLPSRQRQHLPPGIMSLHNFPQDRPLATPRDGSSSPTDKFRAAVRQAKLGHDQDIPHISAAIVVKYVTDFQLLGLL